MLRILKLLPNSPLWTIDAFGISINPSSVFGCMNSMDLGTMQIGGADVTGTLADNRSIDDIWAAPAAVTTPFRLEVHACDSEGEIESTTGKRKHEDLKSEYKWWKYENVNLGVETEDKKETTFSFTGYTWFLLLFGSTETPAQVENISSFIDSVSFIVFCYCNTPMKIWKNQAQKWIKKSLLLLKLL